MPFGCAPWVTTLELRRYTAAEPMPSGTANPNRSARSSRQRRKPVSSEEWTFSLVTFLEGLVDLFERLGRFLKKLDHRGATFIQAQHCIKSPWVGRYCRASRITQALGWTILLAGVAATVKTMVPTGRVEVPAPFGWFAMSALLLAVGYRFIRFGLLAEMIDSSTRSRDARRRVLYARPFSVDQVTVSFGPITTQGDPMKAGVEGLLIGSAFPFGGSTRFEDYAVSLLERIGPVDCLADPRETGPQLGAWRHAAQNANWQSTFLKHAATAQLAVIVVDDREAVLWEIEQVFSLTPAIPVVLVLSVGAVSDSFEMKRQRYSRIQSLLAQVLPTPLPHFIHRPLVLWYRPPHAVGLITDTYPRVRGGEKTLRALRDALQALYPERNLHRVRFKPKDWLRRVGYAACLIFLLSGIVSGFVAHDPGNCSEPIRLYGIQMPVATARIERFLDAASRGTRYAVTRKISLLEPCRPDADLAAMFRSVESNFTYVSDVHALHHGDSAWTGVGQGVGPLKPKARSTTSACPTYAKLAALQLRIDALRPLFDDYIAESDRPRVASALAQISREITEAQYADQFGDQQLAGDGTSDPRATVRGGEPQRRLINAQRR